MDESQLDRIERTLGELGQKLEATQRAAQQTRKYLLWTGIITVVVIVVPLLLLPLFIPAFLASQGVGLGL